MNTLNKNIAISFTFFGKGMVRAHAHAKGNPCFPVAQSIKKGRRLARVDLKQRLLKEEEWINSPQRVWNWL